MIDHERHMETARFLAEISAWKGVAYDLYGILAEIRDKAYHANGDPTEILESIYKESADYLMALGPRAEWE